MMNGDSGGRRRYARAAVTVDAVEPAGYDRRQVRLAPGPDALSLTGALVADACHAWQLPRLLHRARLVMSELTLNAVEHAGTDLVAVVERRGGALRVAVSDGDARLPRPRRPVRPAGAAPLDERGWGLRTVEATASVWGATPTATGKTVWAVLR